MIESQRIAWAFLPPKYRISEKRQVCIAFFPRAQFEWPDETLELAFSRPFNTRRKTMRDRIRHSSL